MTSTILPSVASIASARPDEASGEQRFLINNMDWDGYETLLAVFGDAGPRMWYLDGMLELMSPGPIHEQFSQLLGKMVFVITLELNIDTKDQGSTTQRRRDRKRGLEPDQSFYLASVALLRGQDLGNLQPLPPPDLVIEVEATSPLLDKLSIYAGLGIPEVWRYNQDGLTILCLGSDDQYVVSEQSRALPFLPVADFRAQLASYDPDAETAWFRSYREWVRTVVAPLYQP